MINDLRYSLRMLRNNPGYATVAVLTLAFGIGVNANIFSLVSVIFFQPLPLPNAHEIAMVYQRSAAFNLPHGISYPDYKDYRERNRVFTDLAASLPQPAHLSASGQTAERTWIEVVSPNYFALAGVNAALGRVFQAEEGQRMDSGPVTVLNYRYWQRRFGGDPQIVGRTIQINGQPFTVIGIAPPNFSGMQWAMSLSAFVPSPFASRIIDGGENMLENRGAPMWRTYGRLKPGVGLAQARLDIAGIADQLKKEFPDQHKGVTSMVIPEMRARPDPVFSDYMPVIAALFTGMVTLVLFIACANVANLMFSKALARQRELSLRAALGATRWHLIRQLLSESLVLAALAGIVGLAFAIGAGRALTAFTPQSDIPVNLDHQMDWRVYVFTASIALIAGIAAGLAPALKASKFEVFETLKEAASGRLSSFRHPFRNLLVVSQVTLSLVVLICAGLFLHSLSQFKEAALGLRTDHLLLASVDLGLQRYNDDRGIQFNRQLLEQVRALPGVVSADLARHVPFDTGFSMDDVQTEDRDANASDQYSAMGANVVSSGFLQTVGAQFLQGRGFTAQDIASAPRVAVINDTLGRKLWPNQNPLGRRLRIRQNQQLVEVVGVVATGKYLMLGEDPRPYFYLPLEQRYVSPITLFVRTSVEPASLSEAVRATVRSLDPDLPVFNLRTLEEHVRTSPLGLMPIRMGATMAGIQGFIGLLLAILGLYAVVAYAVTQRTQEIGIRMALGAQPWSVLRLVVREGLRLTLIGIVLGLVISAGASFVFAKVLYGVRPLDLWVFLGVTILLVSIASLACYLPARRAMKVDPMVALRYE
jgi:putative ABC transport system permease protein